MFSQDKVSFKFDVLLAYNRQDIDDVLYFYEELVRRGLKPWMDVKEIWGGETWPVAIDRGIRDSKTAAFFISEKGIGNWQKSELMTIYMAYVNKGMPLHGPIPILLSPVKEIPDDFEKLKPFNSIYFEKINDSIAMGRLEASIRRLPNSFREKSPYGIFVKVPQSSESLSFFIATPEQGMEEIYQKVTEILARMPGSKFVSQNQISGNKCPAQKLAVDYIRSTSVFIAICDDDKDSNKPNSLNRYDLGVALGIALALGKPAIIITNNKESFMRNSMLCIDEDRILECVSLNENSLRYFLEEFESKLKEVRDRIQPPFLIEKALDDIKVRYWDDIQCTYPTFVSDFFTIADFVEDIYYFFPDVSSLIKQMLEIVKDIDEASNSNTPTMTNTRTESFIGKWIEYKCLFEEVNQSFFSTLQGYQVDIDLAFESFIREANADMKTALEPARDNYKILKERLSSYLEFHGDVIDFFQEARENKEISNQLEEEEEKEKQNIRNVLSNRNKVTRIYGALAAYVKGTGAVIEKTHEIMIKLLQVIEHRSGRNERGKHSSRNQEKA